MSIINDISTPRIPAWIRGNQPLLSRLTVSFKAILETHFMESEQVLLDSEGNLKLGQTTWFCSMNKNHETLFHGDWRLRPCLLDIWLEHERNVPDQDNDQRHRACAGICDNLLKHVLQQHPWQFKRTAKPKEGEYRETTRYLLVSFGR